MKPSLAKSGKAARLRLAVFALALTLGALLISMDATASYRPACGACHARLVAAQAKTAHKDLSCNSCHRRPGLAGAIDFRFRLLAMGGAFVSGSRRMAFADSGACQRCHSSDIKQVVVADGIRMSHKEVVAVGMECLDCHGETGHRDATPAPSSLAMDVCLTCHVVSAISYDCATCHVGKVTKEWRLRSGSFARTHGRDWKKMHGMGDLRLCGACHTAVRCTSCHGTPLPHALSWLNDHGAESTRVNCSQCHARSFCDSCHRIRMPHPSDFIRRHPAEGRKDSKRCYRCHAKEACDRCHTGHVHPGLTKERAQRLRKKAGLPWK